MQALYSEIIIFNKENHKNLWRGHLVKCSYILLLSNIKYEENRQTVVIIIFLQEIQRKCKYT